MRKIISNEIFEDTSVTLVVTDEGFDIMYKGYYIEQPFKNSEFLVWYKNGTKVKNFKTLEKCYKFIDKIAKK